jgi:hypothetical protein
MATRDLENSLGKRLTAKEVAEHLGLDVSVVRKHYAELGGVRIGRQYLFFENLIVEHIKRNANAILGQREAEVAGRGHQSGEQEVPLVQPEIRSEGVGSRPKGSSIGRILKRNAHGVFPRRVERELS